MCTWVKAVILLQVCEDLLQCGWGNSSPWIEWEATSQDNRVLIKKWQWYFLIFQKCTVHSWGHVWNKPLLWTSQKKRELKSVHRYQKCIENKAKCTFFRHSSALSGGENVRTSDKQREKTHFYQQTDLTFLNEEWLGLVESLNPDVREFWRWPTWPVVLGTGEKGAKAGSWFEGQEIIGMVGSGRNDWNWPWPAWRQWKSGE